MWTTTQAHAMLEPPVGRESLRQFREEKYGTRQGMLERRHVLEDSQGIEHGSS